MRERSLQMRFRIEDLLARCRRCQDGDAGRLIATNGARVFRHAAILSPLTSVWICIAEAVNQLKRPTTAYSRGFNIYIYMYVQQEVQR